MNKIILTGRLVRDAELSYIASTATPKMSFSIAVERNYQKDKNNKKVDFNKNLLHILTQYMCKSTNKTFKSLIEKEEAEKKAKFNSVILMPHFLKESKKWENKIGIPLKFWSEAEHVKFKAYFMKKYGDMIK